jgi:hypothetical protein
VKQCVHALRGANERVVVRSTALRDVKVDDRIGVGRPAATTQICRETDRIEKAAPQMRR